MENILQDALALMEIDMDLARIGLMGKERELKAYSTQGGCAWEKS